MKQIILFFTLFCLSISWSFASDLIDVSVNTDTLQIGESLQLQISVQDTGELSGKQDIRIPWIENFKVFSKSEGYNFQNINGKTHSTRQFILDLRPLASGTFTLWPVELASASGSLRDDEKIEVRVQDIIPSSKKPQKTATPSKNTPSHDETVSDKAENEAGQIMGLRKPSLSLLGIGLLIFGFLSLFYILLATYLQPQNSKHKTLPQREKKTESSQNYQSRYIAFFMQLKNEIPKLTTQNFFRKYNASLRELLWKQGYEFAPKATLSELKKHQKITTHPVFMLLEKSYEFEFHEQEHTQQEKEKYIDDILSYLKQ